MSITIAETSTRVIGSSSTPDTAYFRTLLNPHLEADPDDIHRSAVGEHGDSEGPADHHSFLRLPDFD
ncbi:MAG: hypothetical protein H7062_13320 [Candidatus Saccharimonas sp.]|nr:hypothetical protein [Planctomycetaceae bacterium]